MKLGKFVDKYIKDNSNIYIHKIVKKDGEERIETIWHGMSWQCTCDKLNLQYMKRRLLTETSEKDKEDFMPCKYRKNTKFYVSAIEHDVINRSSAVDIFLKTNKKER